MPDSPTAAEVEYVPDNDRRELAALLRRVAALLEQDA